jgi:hypothetical protein
MLNDPAKKENHQLSAFYAGNPGMSNSSFPIAPVQRILYDPQIQIPEDKIPAQQQKHARTSSIGKM